tara:strand:+ start:1483 stop:1824 length:342 start_codon:yes stop_codon:yes gene_type:complete
MNIYLVHEDDDGLGEPFVGYFATKLEATRALREAIKNRFEGEQAELEDRLDGTEEYDADDYIVEGIKSGIGGRPRKIQAGEIRKLKIGAKASMVVALNDAVGLGVDAAGGEAA